MARSTNRDWDAPDVGADFNTWGTRQGNALGATLSGTGAGNTIDQDMQDALDNAAAAQTDATQALSDAATADGKAVAAQTDATQALNDAAAANSNANTRLPKDGSEPMTGRLDMVTASVTSVSVIGSGVQNFDLSAGNYFSVNLTGNATFTFTNIPNVADQEVAAIVRVATNGNAITWGTAFNWPGGSPPAASAGIDIYACTFKPGGSEDAWRVAENLS